MSTNAVYPLIYSRISLAMAEMEAVGKEKKNTQQGWSFRSIDQIKNASNPVFAKHQIFYTPEVLEHTMSEKDTSKGGKLTNHIMKVRYKLHTIDGSSVECIVIGEAADSGDKGAGKAQTYAEKIMLCQVLNIPTEDLDPDQDTHEFVSSKAKPVTGPKNETSGSVNNKNSNTDSTSVPTKKVEPGAHSSDGILPASERIIGIGDFKGMKFGKKDLVWVREAIEKAKTLKSNPLIEIFLKDAKDYLIEKEITL